MKTSLVVFILLLTCLTSHAQLSKRDSITNQIIASDTLTPRKGEKQFTFALADNSGFFIYKKYTSPNTALRFGLSGNYLFSSHEYPNIDGPSSENKTRAFVLQLSFGLQRSFGNFKRFEPYYGADLSIGNRMESNTYINSNPLNGIGSSSLVETRQERKVYVSPVISITPLLGFNYYIAERFALGAEYRISLINFNVTNNAKSTITHKYADGTSNTQELKAPDHVSFSGQFRGVAYVTATLFINCK